MKKLIIATALAVAASGAFASDKYAAQACSTYGDIAGDYAKMKVYGASKVRVMNHLDSLDAADRVKDSVRPIVHKLFATNMTPVAFSNWAIGYCLNSVIPEFKRNPLTEDEE
jgi:hypothetical protein